MRTFFDHDLTVYICVFDRTAYEFSKNLFAEISEVIDDDYVEEYKEASVSDIRAFESAVLPSEIVQAITVRQKQKE